MIPVNKVSTCSSILTRTRQTLINLHLTVSSKVAQLTGAEVVIEMVLKKEEVESSCMHSFTNAKRKGSDNQSIDIKSLSFSYICRLE